MIWLFEKIPKCVETFLDAKKNCFDHNTQKHFVKVEQRLT